VINVIDDAVFVLMITTSLYLEGWHFYLPSRVTLSLPFYIHFRLLYF